MKTLAEAISAIEMLATQLQGVHARLDALETAAGNRQRGPKADRAMTEQDAWDVKFGRLKDLNHKEAAAELGLSYGQVFSCRGSYTFKHVRADWRPKGDAPAVHNEGS